jgi:putative FmdB family regulatory protein
MVDFQSPISRQFKIFAQAQSETAMPTYEYVCDACDHEFELFQSIKDEPKRKCPECGKNKLRRLIGPGAALVFKGSGFYKTDYRSESYRKAAAAEKSSAAPASSDGKGKDKSKSETKA